MSPKRQESSGSSLVDQASAKPSEDAIDALVVHIRATHFLLIAACFTLVALVATAEPKRRYSRAQEDLEGIKRAIGTSTTLNLSPFGGGLNLSAKKFLETSPSEDVRPGDPFVERDCVSLELSDDLRSVLAPYLVREFPNYSSYDPGVVFDESEETAYLIHFPEGTQFWKGSPADLATWFYVWDGLRDPLPALRLLPESLSWFELQDLPSAVSSGLSKAFSATQYMGSNEHIAAQLARVDLASAINDRTMLPTRAISLASGSRCLSILSDSFYLVQLQQLSGNAWRALFVLPDREGGDSPGIPIVLRRIAVLDARLERSTVTMNWQDKIVEQARVSWKPGLSADTFPDLVELTQGVDSMRIAQASRFLENLERQAAASEGRVTVASVDLPAQLAATWGIGIVLILQLYLHLHVLRLKDITRGAPVPFCAWIGLYPGSFSRIVSALSICVPPFVSIVAIVIAATRNGTFDRWLEQAGFYASPFASLALGVLTVVAVGGIGKSDAKGER